MTVAQKYSFRQAETALSVANTPLFLLRKLRSDAVVVEIARDLHDEELLNALRTAAQHEPTNIRESVLPYVYLVAVALKGKRALLEQAANVDAPHAKWFKYISSFLLQSFVPTSRKTISILTPTTRLRPDVSKSTSVTTSVKNIKLTTRA
jgi:hypothetical protein